MKHEVCSTLGCGNEVYCKGVCKTCYNKARVARNPLCTVDGCQDHVYCMRTGLCLHHYQLDRTNKPGVRDAEAAAASKSAKQKRTRARIAKQAWYWRYSSPGAEISRHLARGRDVASIAMRMRLPVSMVVAAIEKMRKKVEDAK